MSATSSIICMLCMARVTCPWDEDVEAKATNERWVKLSKNERRKHDEMICRACYDEIAGGVRQIAGGVRQIRKGESCIYCDDSIAYGLVPGDGDPPMCHACRTAHAAGLAEGAAQERARIVAWLSGPLSGDEAEEIVRLIESGAHLPESERET